MRLEAYLHYILRLFQIPQGVLPVGRRWPNLQIDQGHARLRLSGIWSIPYTRSEVPTVDARSLAERSVIHRRSTKEYRIQG